MSDEERAFPYLGQIGREEGTRELVFSSLPYIAVYRVKESAIDILLRHGAQIRRNPLSSYPDNANAGAEATTSE